MCPPFGTISTLLLSILPHSQTICLLKIVSILKTGDSLMTPDWGNCWDVRKQTSQTLWFLPWVSLQGDISMLQDYSLIEETGMYSFNIFFEILQNCPIFFRVYSGFIRIFLEVNGQYASTIPKQSAENFLHWTVEKKKIFCTGSLF